MFAFGKNWDSFSELISEDRIVLAEEGLKRLFPNDELRGKAFFDIGCGSGLSMLAASRLGASDVHGIDVDADSVSTAQRVMETFGGGVKFSVRHKSVFDLSDADGQFPIVHSWGVLHHTGDMWRAIKKASERVAPGGLFVLALYRETPFCSAWKVEKRIYSSAPKPIQSVISAAYKTAFFAGKIAKRDNPFSYVRDYNLRGMSWSHDVHDWLGGYPYESVRPDAVVSYLKSIGFNGRQTDKGGPTVGLFGSYCNEYAATRL